MTEIGGFAGALAMLLDREEREVVLGDLAEGGMSSWQGSFEIAGLLVRSQVTLLQSWRTWAAGVGLALPASFLLMGASVAVSQAGVQVLSGHLETEMFLLLSRLLLLAAWAWTCGFVVVKLSRKTVWMSLLLCLSPCLFCLSRFRIESLSRLSLLLFLIPAAFGARSALRVMRVDKLLAAGIAVVVVASTVVMQIHGGGYRMPQLFLMWPACYVLSSSYKFQLPFHIEKGTAQ